MRPSKSQRQLIQPGTLIGLWLAASLLILSAQAVAEAGKFFVCHAETVTYHHAGSRSEGVKPFVVELTCRNEKIVSMRDTRSDSRIYRELVDESNCRDFKINRDELSERAERLVGDAGNVKTAIDRRTGDYTRTSRMGLELFFREEGSGCEIITENYKY